MTFNIATRTAKADTFLHLRDPETDSLLWADEAETQPVGIELYGKASKQYKAILSELARKAVQRKGKANSFEENVEDNVKILLAVSKAGVNIDYNGVAINSPEVFKEMYEDAGLYWIRDQVQETLDDTAAFLK